MSISTVEVERRNSISSEEFKLNHVNRSRPVVILGATKNWKALECWSPDYFRRIAPETKVTVKEFLKSGIKSSPWTIEQYAKFLESHENVGEQHDELNPPPYCHDVPIFSLIDTLVNDVQPFPLDYFPDWYRHKWWRYVQFFMGPSGSLTPLHFDCLLTNNLFFQIAGRKRFTIIPPEDAEYCYRYGWRWFKVDPEKPDFNKYPQYRKVKPISVLVNPGDILYLPPGTIHHVRSLDPSISFNIDWHTRESSLKGIAAILKGMPLENVYYNFLSALGLVFRLSPDFIFRYYKSYLNYVS